MDERTASTLAALTGLADALDSYRTATYAWRAADLNGSPEKVIAAARAQAQAHSVTTARSLVDAAAHVGTSVNVVAYAEMAALDLWAADDPDDLANADTATRTVVDQLRTATRPPAELATACRAAGAARRRRTAGATEAADLVQAFDLIGLYPELHAALWEEYKAMCGVQDCYRADDFDLVAARRKRWTKAVASELAKLA